MTMGGAFICDSCERFRMWDSEHDKAWCEAFPDGIPEAIIYGGADHRQPIHGDNGIRYLPDPERKDSLAAYEADVARAEKMAEPET
jgi:hypothetical protein